jgi:hypothetical protein
MKTTAPFEFDLRAQLFTQMGELRRSRSHFLLQLRGTAQLHGMRHHLE